MKLYALSVSVLTLLPLCAAAPRSSLEPAEPKWGENVRLVYHAAAAGARLPLNQPVTALLTLTYEDGHFQQRCLLMQTSDADRVASFVVPGGASFAIAQFITRDASDGMVTALIDDASGKPARGAWMQSITRPSIQTDYRERVVKELALYPDNWAVYREKWFAGGVHDGAELKQTVFGDMANIEKGAPTRPAGALYSMSYGKLLLNDEPSSRALIREMIDRFPDDTLTLDAITSYEYQGYVQHFEEAQLKEVGDWGAQLFASHPDSAWVRNAIDIYGVAQRLTPAMKEAICKPWIHDDPENPRPYYELAQAWKDDATHTQDAYRYAVKSLELMLAGELRLRGDVAGQMTSLLTPDAARTAAKLALDLKDFAAALSYVRLAESTGNQTTPQAFALEAGIWAALGRDVNQAAAWKEAWQRGDEKAYPQLIELHLATTGAAEGLEAWIAKLPSIVPGRRKLPDFAATALDGRRLSAADLRGKVVVANFWFTGCGPCKAEIPDLNRLVHEFEGKGVVFVAFSNDDDVDTLHRFLKTVPFDYAVVPDSGKIATQFGVQSYPSHAVIGQDGTIESFLTGAGDHRAAQLRTIITRLLAN